MKTDRRFRLARKWSNEELRKIAPLVSGDIANISAGEDIDKEGATYDSYFTGKRSYSITNFGPGTYRGFQGQDNEYLLDLTSEIPPPMERRFDVVFNHTTLEHVFDAGIAFGSLCQLSKDVVILVVPFSQVEHSTESYGDFWRFTPACIRRLFDINGFTVVYESANDDFNAAIYLFFVAARYPNKWRDRMPAYDPIRLAGRRIGELPATPRLGHWTRAVRRSVSWAGRVLRGKAALS